MWKLFLLIWHFCYALSLLIQKLLWNHPLKTWLSVSLYCFGQENKKKQFFFSTTPDLEGPMIRGNSKRNYIALVIIKETHENKKGNFCFICEVCLLWNYTSLTVMSDKGREESGNSRWETLMTDVGQGAISFSFFFEQKRACFKGLKCIDRNIT